MDLVKIENVRGVHPADVEQLFYKEAGLLDAHEFESWLGLLTEDVRYEVPALDRPAGPPEVAFKLIDDDIARLRSRVKQLLEGWNLGENPPSRTRRLVTNVRITAVRDDALDVTANFAVYRFRHEIMDVYIGRFENVLVAQAGLLKIRRRRAILDNESLRPHGKLTILL